MANKSKTPVKGIIEEAEPLEEAFELGEQNDQHERILPADSELDPSVAMVASENHSIRTEKASSVRPRKAEFDAAEEAVASQEKAVAVKPNSTFSCTIGLRRYDFIKNVPVTVPLSVKEVLANGAKIYP